MIDFESIKAVDPEICDAMRKELTRQREHLELIASENFVSDAVLPKDIRESAITAAANMSISLKSWRANAPRRFSGRNTPMCSPIPARRPIWRSILPCSSRAIR